MNFDFVDFIAVVSFIAAIVIIYKIVTDYMSLRKQINVVGKSVDDNGKSEYAKILDATYWLEHERQKNQGEHFEDESVYLNRAQVIRTETCFFSLVNE